jgi:hypothetical protein
MTDISYLPDEIKRRQFEKMFEGCPGSADGGRIIRNERDLEFVLKRIEEGEKRFRAVKLEIFKDVCRALRKRKNKRGAWAKELCKRCHVPTSMTEPVIARLEGRAGCVDFPDPDKLIPQLDDLGFFKDIFRAAIVKQESWALYLVWENGISHGCLQNMWEDGKLEL